jgi:hypothetical protein
MGQQRENRMAKKSGGRRARTRKNVHTLKTPPRVERTDTPVRAEITETPVRTKTTAAVIAEKLKRTISATYNKVRALGVSVGIPRKRKKRA